MPFSHCHYVGKNVLFLFVVAKRFVDVPFCFVGHLTVPPLTWLRASVWLRVTRVWRLMIILYFFSERQAAPDLSRFLPIKIRRLFVGVKDSCRVVLLLLFATCVAVSLQCDLFLLFFVFSAAFFIFKRSTFIVYERLCQCLFIG